MKNRTRPVRIEFRVTEQERQLIQKKMEQLGTKNMGAYLRKMAIDGYIIKVDYTEQKKLAASVSRVAGNINQICRRINQTGHFYEDDTRLCWTEQVFLRSMAIPKRTARSVFTSP